ncbi:MAG: trypsin-like peptidase domain-containing protein [Sellimonas intestinalis]
MPPRILAVVAVPLKQISSDTKDSIKVAVLGDSENLLVGEEVIAIGNALGYGQSVTNGIVSAKDREIEMEGFDSKLIQTNAAINPETAAERF